MWGFIVLLKTVDAGTTPQVSTGEATTSEPTTATGTVIINITDIGSSGVMIYITKTVHINIILVLVTLIVINFKDGMFYRFIKHSWCRNNTSNINRGGNNFRTHERYR